MLSEKLGHSLDKPLATIARKIPLSPNALTVAGFALTLLSGPVLAYDLRLGAFCMLPAGLLDMLDGVVARVQGKNSAFGAFLDSVLDRYSDAVILLAIAWNFGMSGNMTGVVLSGVTLTGSLIISYARARAEGLGASCAHGLMERPDRLILLFLGAVSGYMTAVLWILALLTHITVIQRILHTRKQIISPQ
jgi:phosphatidylglycerophosphate synthase